MLFLAIDRSGGPTNNNIYMLASVIPSGRTTTDVMFVRSTDGGVTLARRTRSMMIRSIPTSGIGLEHFRLHLMGGSMRSGTTREMPRTTLIRSYSIVTALTPVLHGQLT